MNDKAITTKTNTAPVLSQADQTFGLLQQAVQSGTSPEAMEKLVALQERIMAHDAKQKFIQAMSDFQSRCPTITKVKEVKARDGRMMYRFAPLESVIAQVQGLLSEVGFSYAFDSTFQANGACEVTCTIRHAAGHSESSHVMIPATQGHNTNPAQNMGIQLTYGKRYAFLGALGITTADEDADGDGGSQKLKPISDEQVADLISLLDEVGGSHEPFLKYMGVKSFAEIPEKEFDRGVAAIERKRAQK